MSRNRLTGGFISMCSVTILVACIAFLSRDVTGSMTTVYADPLSQLSVAGLGAQRYVGMAREGFMTYYEANSALVSYGTGALVLVGFMLRSARSI